MKSYKFVIYSLVVFLFSSCSVEQYEFSDSPYANGCTDYEVDFLSKYSCDLISANNIENNQYVIINSEEVLKKYTDCSFQELGNRTIVVLKQTFDAKVTTVDPYLRHCETSLDFVINVQLDASSTEIDQVAYGFVLPYKIESEEFPVRFTVSE